MKMIGHRTEAIYRRYTIADEGLSREAGQKVYGEKSLAHPEREDKRDYPNILPCSCARSLCLAVALSRAVLEAGRSLITNSPLTGAASGSGSQHVRECSDRRREEIPASRGRNPLGIEGYSHRAGVGRKVDKSRTVTTLIPLSDDRIVATE